MDPNQEQWLAQQQYYAAVNSANSQAIASLVLGILSLLTLFGGPFTGLFSLIMAIIGVVLGSKARKVLPYNARGMATAGFVCSIISLVILGIGILIALFVIMFGISLGVMGV